MKSHKSNLIKSRFLRRGENLSDREEKLQTQLTRDAESGNRTRATEVGSEYSHYYATTAKKNLLIQTCYRYLVQHLQKLGDVTYHVEIVETQLSSVKTHRRIFWSQLMTLSQN